MSVRLARLGASLAIAILCAPLAAADGLVWALKGKTNTVYIAGSVHLLKRNDAKLPASLERAYAESEALVMELDLDDLDPMQAARWLLERGTFTDGRTLKSAIGEERHAQFAAAVEELGLPIEAFERFEPWAAALTLVELAYARLEFDANSGVERQLEALARRDGKDIAGLETVEEQLGMLDELSAQDQRRFLEQTVDELDELAEQTDEMLAAWRKGDSKWLENMLAEEYAAFPSLYRALVLDRNARWMPRIEQLLAEKDDQLIVVGVLHLIGDEGLIALAKKRGLKPKPFD